MKVGFYNANFFSLCPHENCFQCVSIEMFEMFEMFQKPICTRTSKINASGKLFGKHIAFTQQCYIVMLFKYFSEI
jgi:hypothetical protein